MKFFGYELVKSNRKHGGLSVRSMLGALYSRFVDTSQIEWPTLAKINNINKIDYQRTLELSKGIAFNNPVIRSYLELMEKNVIGKSGFVLQSQLKKANGELDKELNDYIEWEYYDWCKASNGYLTVDGKTGGKELDKLILRTLLIEGEVFIRIHKRKSNPYGVSFEVLDSMNIDFTKNKEFSGNQNAIFMGIEIDRNYKPVSYHVIPGDTSFYITGKGEEIPASEIIHIFIREYPGQIRGIPPFNSCFMDLQQLAEYQTAELAAAKAGACFNIVYEPNDNLPTGNFNDESDYADTRTDSDSEPASNMKNFGFIQKLSPLQATIVPRGYTAKGISSSHPNNNFDNFTKSVLKKIGASLGISYNQICKDYESVNFSSLRESAADSKTYFESVQEFLIDNWKEIQFRLFLEQLVLNSDQLKATQIKQAMRQHNFICAKRAWYDPSRDILATKYALELGVKNPLQVIDENGCDPNEILDGWKLWKQMCASRDLNFNDEGEKTVVDPVEDKSDEDQMNEDRSKKLITINKSIKVLI